MSGRNKQRANSFLDQVMSGDVREAFQIHVHDDFVHHDLRLREGAQALADALHADQVLYPARTFMIERSIEEGDLVAVHSRLQLAPTEPVHAHVHILRFRNDRIYELWHVSEQVPDEPLNTDGAF
jgi:predicted SnoaL-like aldol condensation-catalyzing enzyme